MKIQSMTGFAKLESEDEKYILNIEIKSVNHRFKDFRFKMGNIFNSIEINLRKQLEKEFTRGSFDIYINYKKKEHLKKKVEVDYTKVNNFLNEFKENCSEKNLVVNPSDFIRADFLKEESEHSELISLALESFPNVLKELKKTRLEEGHGLIDIMNNHKKIFQQNLKTVISSKDKYQEIVREKVLKNLKNEKLQSLVDETRLNQEIIHYLEKLDIDEELNRIDLHLKKLESLLCTDGEVGRQIDFILQELNRETNTIGSKSGESEISLSVVQMKVQLEKMREQGLNLQ